MAKRKFFISLALLCFPRSTTSNQSVVTSVSIKSIITAFPVFVKTYTVIMQQFSAYILRLDLASSHKFSFYRERQECGEAKVFDFSMIMEIDKI